MITKIGSKSQLAVILSRLKVFQRVKVRIEQYPTDSEIAAEVLWSAFMSGNVEDKVIADLGCGTGILGLGALLLGAKRAYLIDIDKDALEIAKNNYLFLKSEGFIEGNSNVEFINKDINNIKEFMDKEKTKSDKFKIDTVLQNPPFGTRIKHIDKLFLDKAIELGDVIYSFHKSSTEGFIKEYAKDQKVRITNIFRFDFPLKKSLEHHKKRIQIIKVSCFRLEKNK